MKYEALKEDTKIRKCNSDTLIFTILAEILNLIMKAEKEVYVEKNGDSKNGFYPGPLEQS